MDNTEEFKNAQVVNKSVTGTVSVTKTPWYKQPIYWLLIIFVTIVIVFWGLVLTGNITLSASDLQLML